MRKDGLGKKAPSLLLRRTMMSWMASAIASGLFLIEVASIASQESRNHQAGASMSSPASELAGSKACVSCHSQIVQEFESNPHNKSNPSHSMNGNVCEGCHGPGKAHVESKGGVRTIFNPATGLATDVNTRCLRCHSDHLAGYPHSVHTSAGLSCVSCHSVHGELSDQRLLKAQQPILCFQCHSNSVADFSMPFHHMVTEARPSCSDCHDPHDIGAQETKDVAELNARCAKCHTNEAGPFKYEHEVVRAEGCISCHAPHGSSNIHILKQRDVNALCESCHSVTGPMAHSQMLRPTGHSDARTARETSCIDCHAAFHGSNLDTAFLK
jgi:DmsE family decaheme c-type cytochrome